MTSPRRGLKLDNADSFGCFMTVLKTETETAIFSRNTDRNRPSSDDPEP